MTRSLQRREKVPVHRHGRRSKGQAQENYERALDEMEVATKMNKPQDTEREAAVKTAVSEAKLQFTTKPFAKLIAQAFNKGYAAAKGRETVEGRPWIEIDGDGRNLPAVGGRYEITCETQNPFELWVEIRVIRNGFWDEEGLHSDCNIIAYREVAEPYNANAQLSQHGAGQAVDRVSDLIKSAESELLSSQDSEYPDEAFEGRVQARISALYECRHIASAADKSGREDARREIAERLSKAEKLIAWAEKQYCMAKFSEYTAKFEAYREYIDNLTAEGAKQ